MYTASSKYNKKVIVLNLMLCDRLSFPAAVIQSLLQAETFSLLCFQSRAYGSFQSPRHLGLRQDVYGYPEFDMGNR